MLAGSTFTLGDIGFESISAIALQVWGLPQNVLELPEMYPLVISSILFAASGHNLFLSCINPHRDLRLSPSSITKRSYIYFFFLNVSEQSSPYSRVYMGDKGWAAHPTMNNHSSLYKLSSTQSGFWTFLPSRLPTLPTPLVQCHNLLAPLSSFPDAHTTTTNSYLKFSLFQSMSALPTLYPRMGSQTHPDLEGEQGLFFCINNFFFFATPMAYGTSQASDQIQATSATWAAGSLTHCSGCSSNLYFHSDQSCCSHILNPLQHSGNFLNK